MRMSIFKSLRRNTHLGNIRHCCQLLTFLTDDIVSAPLFLLLFFFLIKCGCWDLTIRSIGYVNAKTLSYDFNLSTHFLCLYFDGVQPAGRAIQVETGYGERLPSTDTRPPRNRDLDVIIEVRLSYVLR